MTIKPGDKLPQVPESLTEGEPTQKATISETGKIIIVGVPGAFTPPCSDHVPTYILGYDELQKKGVQEIYIVGVNDQFVLNAWKKHLATQHGATDAQLNHIHFLADRSADYVKLLGLDFDASGLLGGIRSRRFALVVQDGVVKEVRVEENPPDLKLTAADHISAVL